ncbi:lipoate--protein ligase family protein [Brevibacillus sp. SYP-B805]|uniref:lipoyl protein ligase domain-containing protein n=1 Tax=Brevibacillus sp. SYP-B805 TaxID=1578199 RepID=UPI001F497C8F|nr:lipoate--protein ligase family protein [Brevibacillus sp. SYP-B805]
MDSGTHQAQPIEPLILDEALSSGMSDPGAIPLIHVWVYDKALFLGRRDAKLPHLEPALRQMGREGYGAVLRSSGGACVPLDAGVLNMAFHLPDTTLSIDAFFSQVAAMLAVGLGAYGEIAFGEVSGSYCAGEYDFACGGKKIGGMAQRRTRYGSILQLCINVDQRPRGELMERFYLLAGLEEMEKNKPIPVMDGSTIGSLAEATGVPLHVDEVKERLFEAIARQWSLEKTTCYPQLERLESARQHLLNRLGLFSYRAEELAQASWALP